MFRRAMGKGARECCEDWGMIEHPVAAPARTLSLMQPTAESLHLGNYLGALTRWVALQEDFEAFYGVADLHALTTGPDPATLRARTRATAAQFLAAGVDPGRSVLFVQSHVPEHAELAWVLGCLTGFGDASRMTQFKDKSQQQGNEGTTVGLFTYPVLMAADILLYDTQRVPVGEDQRQHLELARGLAARLNARYGNVVTVPEAEIVEATAKIFDLQNPAAKMSKSVSSPNGVIDVLDDEKVIAKRIRSAVTDTGREVRFDPVNKAGVSNLLTIHAALSGTPVAELETRFAGRGYGDLKSEVADVVIEHVRPLREAVATYLADPAQLDAVLHDGAQRARAVARDTLARVYDTVGLLAPAPGR